MNRFSDDLVIGGSGFIGWRLSTFLASKGHKVCVFSRTGIPEPRRNVQHERGDILISRDVKLAVVNKSRIFHLASPKNLDANTTDPSIDAGVIVIGTINVLEAVRKYNDKAEILYVSSSAVYGQPKNRFVNESTQPKPINPYGAAKLAAETYCEYYSRTYGLKLVRLRPFNTYGSLRSKDLISATIRQIVRGRPPVIAGDGKQVRDFTYVEDLVRIMDKAVSTPQAEGRVFNVGLGKGVSVLDATKLVSVVFGEGRNIQPVFSGRPSGGRGNVCNIRALRKTVGLVPKTTLKEGLTKMREELSMTNLRRS